jgi:transcriptional regulator with XRE-family HTH domain
MSAEDLGTRFAAALKASGKTGAAVAKEAGTTAETISRIKRGHLIHVRRDLLTRIATAVGTTSAYLLGDILQLSPEDEEELLRHRAWIDKKLPKIDARDEPNAILIASALNTPTRSRHRGDMVADTPQVPKLDVPSAFRRREVQHVLRARGDSMIDAGIVNDDTLYATAVAEPTVGKIIACRWHGDIFVKRVVSERDRFFLRSENPRYLSIEFDPQSPDFEMIGVVIGRLGAVA